MNDGQSVVRLASPPQELGPTADAVASWMDLMETCEQLLLAGLRHKIGPDGDLAAAWRERSARRTVRRDREIAHMLDPSRRPGTGHAV
ncbi:MAG TPA: hypothetical protein VH120_17955 [Gemmataceae bacterium]|nr:hypothetical protein [Gemmataceae bacterium]